MAVEARRGALGMSRGDLAAKAAVDPKTLYNLEKDGKWPIARTRARIEAALGWAPGEMERIASAPAAERRPVIPPEVREVVERADRSDAWKREVLDALDAIGRERRGEGPCGPRWQRAG